jgi:hypothetical protein
VKVKKCKECKAEFVPSKPLQSVCSPKCAIDRATKQRITKERKEYREAKEKQKTRADWMREAQRAFNSYIRERDKKLPCISCGRHHRGQYHAGHYRTVGGNPELRFNELNVWKQCAPCNDHLHGNIVNYRIELERRIGRAKLEWLEGPHQPQKYTIDELKSIKETYKQKLKELKNE